MGRGDYWSESFSEFDVVPRRRCSLSHRPSWRKPSAAEPPVVPESSRGTVSESVESSIRIRILARLFGAETQNSTCRMSRRQDRHAGVEPSARGAPVSRDGTLVRAGIGLVFENVRGEDGDRMPVTISGVQGKND